jgi:hypothetical protein
MSGVDAVLDISQRPLNTVGASASLKSGGNSGSTSTRRPDFVGKTTYHPYDNACCCGRPELQFAWNVSATGSSIQGEKLPKSGGGIWIDEALELFPVDYWRFF